MRVLILGAGPAGMFAAHAAVSAGSDVIIMSKHKKSFMHGAQYLHRPIPGLSTSPSFMIQYALEGDVEGYKRKVYGNTDLRGRNVSPEDLVGQHAAWDIREAYDAAQALYGDSVLPLELVGGGAEVGRLIDWCAPDMVVSTVPANLLCGDPQHGFAAEKVWATDTAPFLVEHAWENTVLCSGVTMRPWYRQSLIQGWGNTEYPERTKPPVSKVWEVLKPLHNNCTCLPNIIRLGRYGLWEKGVLSDGAYYSMQENLAAGIQERLV